MIRLRWLASFAAACVLFGVIVVKIKTKRGKETEVTITVPGEVDSATVNVRKEDSKTVTRETRVTTGPSSFDALDPAAIPATERFDWQPKELVAVIGAHRRPVPPAASVESPDAEVREKNVVQPQPVVPRKSGRHIFVSDNGKHFITHSEDGFQVWRLNGATCQQLDSSNQLRQAYGPVGFLNSTQFTTSGNESYRWKIDSERVVLVGELSDEITPLANGSGGLILSFDFDKPTANLSLWQADKPPGKKIATWGATAPGRELFDLHNRYAFFVSTDGLRFVSADRVPGKAGDPVIRVWHRSDKASAPTEFATISLPNDQLHQLALSPDGQLLAVASQESLSLWKLTANNAERLWQKNEGYAQAVTFSSDGKYLASSFNNTTGAGSGIVTIHNLHGERLHRSKVPPPGPTDLAFSPDGRHLLTANSNGTVYILRLSKDTESR